MGIREPGGFARTEQGHYPGVVQPKGSGTFKLFELIPEIFKAIGQQVGLMG